LVYFITILPEEKGLESSETGRLVVVVKAFWSSMHFFELLSGFKDIFLISLELDGSKNIFLEFYNQSATALKG
jgi:hypothetical protein